MLLLINNNIEYLLCARYCAKYICIFPLNPHTNPWGGCNYYLHFAQTKVYLEVTFRFKPFCLKSYLVHPKSFIKALDSPKWEKTKWSNMVPMPEQKAQLEKMVLCKWKILFDHKGVQIPELNFKEKKERAFTSDHQIHRLKTSKNTFPIF